jgi:hypothetical protein
MQSTRSKLWLAQKEVERTARDQDLHEVPKRAQLDREEEASAEGTVIPTGGAEARGVVNEQKVFDPATALAGLG